VFLSASGIGPVADRAFGKADDRYRVNRCKRRRDSLFVPSDTKRLADDRVETIHRPGRSWKLSARRLEQRAVQE